jgi:hypothetical protein
MGFFLFAAGLAAPFTLLLSAQHSLNSHSKKIDYSCKISKDPCTNGVIKSKQDENFIQNIV